MPWKETCVSQERMRFISGLEEGESMTHMCEKFGISRKTGYKIWKRYKLCGIYALVDRARKPHRFSNQLPEQIEQTIIRLKKEKPHWGAAKIRELLIRKYQHLPVPAVSTVHVVLDRNGLVNCRKRRRRFKAQGTPLGLGQKPNEIWCTDFKGEFMLGDHRYCYPLTMTDHASRYILAVEALDSVREATSFPVFERVFQEYGLPEAIRSDNGVPFAAPNSLFGLSRLAVWWLRLGIRIERIEPGNPQQNGRHERMHLTLKKATVVPPAMNFLQQQQKFDAFIDEFNQERPHQALGMKMPAEIYTPSKRPYQGLTPLEYPHHEQTITVTHCGRICIKGLKISLSNVFAGQDVGVREVQDGLWSVEFMDYELGYFDEQSKTFEPLPNPFAPKAIPMYQPPV